MRLRHALALVPLGVVAAFACGDPSHLYVGREYYAGRDCLLSASALDVVEGEQAAESCEARCFVQPRSDAERRIYVSTMCPPYPFGVDASGTDPACAPALAAFARKDLCFADGGSSSPPPKDAAPE